MATYQCSKCRQSYVLASLGDRDVFMAVEPHGRSLCAACVIEPARR